MNTSSITRPAITVNQEFDRAIRMSIKRCEETQHSFFVIVIQIKNLDTFQRRRPPLVVKGLMREMYEGVRKLVHPSQYVGLFQDGLGLVFDRVDSGQADNISKRLKAIVQNIIQTGRYNDLASRWTEIIYQFLAPGKPSELSAMVGWSIYPRDGVQPIELARRALNHAKELSS